MEVLYKFSKVLWYPAFFPERERSECVDRITKSTINALLITFSIQIFYLLFGQMFVPPNNVLFYSQFINKISDTIS